MASSINASTSGAGGVITTADNSGILNLQSGGVTVATINSTGIVMPSNTAPAFRAYQGTDQNLPLGDTAYTAQLNSVNFDTGSRFNNTGSTVNGIPAYAFMPNIAGYYLVTGSVYTNKSTGIAYGFSIISKNGGGTAYGNYAFNVSVIDNVSKATDLVYLNGTTDYIQLQVQTGGATNVTLKAGTQFTFFSAYLARSA